jgi:hypothetical protein
MNNQTRACISYTHIKEEGKGWKER